MEYDEFSSEPVNKIDELSNTVRQQVVRNKHLT